MCHSTAVTDVLMALNEGRDEPLCCRVQTLPIASYEPWHFSALLTPVGIRHVSWNSFFSLSLQQAGLYVQAQNKSILSPSRAEIQDWQQCEHEILSVTWSGLVFIDFFWVCISHSLLFFKYTYSYLYGGIYRNMRAL